MCMCACVCGAGQEGGAQFAAAACLLHAPCPCTPPYPPWVLARCPHPPSEELTLEAPAVDIINVPGRGDLVKQLAEGIIQVRSRGGQADQQKRMLAWGAHVALNPDHASLTLNTRE